MNISLRPYVCELSNLSRPDGSVAFCHGDTAVQAAVYGPSEVKIQKEIVDKAHIEVIYKPKVGLPGTAEKLRENTIKNICESAIWTALYPRTSITIIIQELEDRGGLLSCAINTACSVLIDSGIEMKYLFSSVTCAVLNDDIILHPSLKQEKEADAVFTVTFDSQCGQILAINSNGLLNATQIQACTNNCRKENEEILKFYRQTVDRRYSKEHTVKNTKVSKEH
uniref:Uncharacterized protein n=1 Tax=Strigamia maritima TaxID=126957 RepID=T1JNA3_STRMM